MKDEVYEYLINYGFNKDNLNKIEQENEDIYIKTGESINTTSDNLGKKFHLMDTYTLTV